LVQFFFGQGRITVPFDDQPAGVNADDAFCFFKRGGGTEKMVDRFLDVLRRRLRGFAEGYLAERLDADFAYGTPDENVF